MNDFSLIEKFNILMNMVNSSPLFLSCILLAVVLLIVYIICLKKEKKVNKWVFISVWGILFLVLIIRYNNIVLSTINGLFNALFMALYFPSLTVYAIMLFITNFSFIYSLIRKSIDKTYKLVNFSVALILDVLLIFIVEIVNTKSININETINVFSDSNLLVLLELTSAIFTSWLLILLLISAKRKLSKYDIKTSKKPEIIFEEI